MGHSLTSARACSLAKISVPAAPIAATGTVKFVLHRSSSLVPVRADYKYIGGAAHRARGIAQVLRRAGARGADVTSSPSQEAAIVLRFRLGVLCFNLKLSPLLQLEVVFCFNLKLSNSRPRQGFGQGLLPNKISYN